MTLDTASFYAGVGDVLVKLAQQPAVAAPSGSTTTAGPAGGTGVFTMTGAPPVFPTRETQAKWRFSYGKDRLQLFDGDRVFSFHLPEGLHHENPVSARQQEVSPTEFGRGGEVDGPVQIHRSDPGQVYFTLQEGRSNPTFTLKHRQGDEWQLVPKRRKTPLHEPVRSVRRLADLLVHPERFKTKTGAEKQAADDEKALQEVVQRRAERPPGTQPNLPPPDTTIPFPNPPLLGRLLNAGQRAVQLPGEMHENWFGGRSGTWGGLGGGMAGNAAVGAALGLAYDQARRRWYNTPEENEAEQQGRKRDLALRVGVPALALSLLGAAQGSLFRPRYADLRAGAGAASNLFG
jgi:hypothetical protein